MLSSPRSLWLKAFANFPAKAELASMLPGFRFLFAAIVLSMSILVFGLGAAALLRAAHEEFASTPSWHAPPETVFAQPAEAAAPVLAMLHVESPDTERKALDDVPPAAAPIEQPATTSMPAETETAAAPQPQDPSPPETAKPEIPVAESPAPDQPAPAASPIAADETKMAVSEEVLPASEAAAAAPEQANAPASAEADIAASKIATLDGPPVTIEAPQPAKPAAAEHDKSSIRKRVQARRANRHRRIALRARLTQQAPQQPVDPFAQPLAAGRRQ